MKKKFKLILVIALIVNLFIFTGCAKNEPDPVLNNSIGWPEGGESGFIDVEGGRVLYHFYGKDKTDIPIIFLHGGPGDIGAYFFKQVALSENHPIVIYNQLGSDGSDYTEGTTLQEAQELMTIEHYVNELETVIDYFDFDEYILLGCSWGTMLAVEYAAAMKPEELKGLVLNGPYLSSDLWCYDQERLIKSLPSQDVCGEMMDGERMWEVILECEEAQVYYDDERYVAIDEIYCDNFCSRPEYEGNIAEKPDDSGVSQYIIEGLSVYDYMWGPSEFTCLGTLRGHDSTVLLQDIQVPILYLCGEYDAGTPETANYYKSLSNNAEVTVISGCAHSSAREKSDEFNAIVEEFTNKITNN